VSFLYPEVTNLEVVVIVVASHSAPSDRSIISESAAFALNAQRDNMVATANSIAISLLFMIFLLISIF
jgi:hypothetical protein